MSDLSEASRDVARACRVLAAHGQDHLTLGHVGIRLADGAGIAVKAAGLGLAEVTTSDVVVTDPDGIPVSADARLHSELPIHTRILHARDDVGAVVHTHPMVAAGFLASDATFACVSQDSVHFLDRLAWFDDPRLIDTTVRGDALAATLGSARAVLIRNHGIVTVGASVAEAVFWAVSLVNSLRVQEQAAAFGGVREIPPDLGREMADAFAEGLERRIEGAWRQLVRGVAVDRGFESVVEGDDGR